MRRQPGQPPKIEPKPNNEVITQVREYELITPLFGGGVDPGEADPVTTIRGSEIRGQLRFWWRACRGGQFNGDLAEMKKAEDRFWGKAYNKNEDVPSQDQLVQITVETLHSGETVKPFNIIPDRTGRKAKPNSDRNSPPSYAAFPLQPSDDDLKKPDFKQKEVRVNIKFRLTISFPANRKTDIEAALWAWETFGGIGARTRRGFGALHLLAINNVAYTDLPISNQEQAREWIKRKLLQFVIDRNQSGSFPTLSIKAQFHVTDSFSDAMGAWKWLIGKLSGFRQTPDGRSGRSNWPEPEAIREITHRRFYKYQTRLGSQKFPRAAFGMPIVFHFKDSGDPEDTTLQGKDKGQERLASPLILRPLLCKGGQAVGLALLLEGNRMIPGGLQLVEKNGIGHDVEATLNSNEAKAIPVLRGETDVLQAFMNYLGGNSK